MTEKMRERIMARAIVGVSASSVLDSSSHDPLPHLLGHGDLLSSNSDIGATVKNSLGCSLDKHLGSVSETSGLLGCAVWGHGLSVSGEFKSVILLPLSFNILADNLGRFKTASRFGQSVWVDFFSKGDESSFSCFSNLLKDVLKVIEVKSGIVTHD